MLKNALLCVSPGTNIVEHRYDDISKCLVFFFDKRDDIQTLLCYITEATELNEENAHLHCNDLMILHHINTTTNSVTDLNCNVTSV